MCTANTQRDQTSAEQLIASDTVEFSAQMTAREVKQLKTILNIFLDIVWHPAPACQYQCASETHGLINVYVKVQGKLVAHLQSLSYAASW